MTPSAHIIEGKEQGMKWYEDHNKLVALGRALLSHEYTAEELQAYYEKPWKWSAEYAALVEWGANGCKERDHRKLADLLSGRKPQLSEAVGVEDDRFQQV